MLMGAKVIDDAAALLAVTHVCVEAAGATGFEIADPSDGFSAERIQIRIIPHRERNFRSLFREHNAPPASDIKKRQSEELAPPNFVHHAFAHRSSMILATEAEPFLNSRVQHFEFIAERLFVNGSH